METSSVVASGVSAPRTTHPSLRTKRRIRIQIHKRETSRCIHFAAIDEHTCFAREFTASSEKIGCIELLSGAELREVRPWKLATIVRACCLDSTSR